MIRCHVQVEHRKRHVLQRTARNPIVDSVANRERCVGLLYAKVGPVHKGVEEALHNCVAGRVVAPERARIVSGRVALRKIFLRVGRVVQCQPGSVERRHFCPAPPLCGGTEERCAICRYVERVGHRLLISGDLLPSLEPGQLRLRRPAHGDGKGAILRDRHGVVPRATAPGPAALEVDLRARGRGGVPRPQVEVRCPARLHHLHVPTSARGRTRRQREILRCVDPRRARVERERPGVHQHFAEVDLAALTRPEQ